MQVDEPHTKPKNIVDSIACGIIIFVNILCCVLCIVSLLLFIIYYNNIETTNINVIEVLNGTRSDCINCRINYTPEIDGNCAAYKYKCGNNEYWTTKYSSNDRSLNYCSNSLHYMCYYTHLQNEKIYSNNIYDFIMPWIVFMAISGCLELFTIIISMLVFCIRIKL